MSIQSASPLPVTEWIEFPAPRRCGPGLIRVPLRPGTPDRSELLRRVSADEMEQPYLFEDGVERRLHFTLNCTQSVMRLNDPNALVTPYTRKMMAFLLLNPTPRNILMLGLGGGSLAKFCYHRLPQANITVVEVNPHIVSLRREFHVPDDNERFRVVQADGAEYISREQDPIDVVLVDAFDPVGIAESLPARMFFARAAERMTKDGVLVMNFWGECDRYVENLRQAAAVFGTSLRIVPTENGGNLVLFASFQTQPRSISPAMESLSQWLERTMSLDFPRYLRRICQAPSLHAR